jgi:hypothetical protein
MTSRWRGNVRTCAPLQSIHLAEVTLEQPAKAGDVRRELTRSAGRSVADHGLLLMGALQYSFGFRSGLADQQLGFLFGLRPGVDSQLLGRDERFIHRTLAISKGTQLLLRAADSFLVLGAVS